MSCGNSCTCYPKGKPELESEQQAPQVILEKTKGKYEFKSGSCR